MVFVGQVGMSPTGEETVGVGGPFTIHRGHSLPTSALPRDSYPSASCVCRADVTASLGSRPLTQLNQISGYPTVKWAGQKQRQRFQQH